MKKLKIDLSTLEGIYEDYSYDYIGLLDTASGEILYEDASSYEDIDAEFDPERYLTVPSEEQYEAYNDMQDFIDTVKDEHLQDLLAVSIRGAGAFRRFKDTLYRDEDVQKQWFAFKSQRTQERILRWLYSEGIEPE